MGILSFFNNNDTDGKSVQDNKNYITETDDLINESVEAASIDEPLESSKAEIVEESLNDEVFEYELEKPVKPDGFYIAEEGEKLAGTGLFGDVDKLNVSGTDESLHNCEADFEEDELLSSSDLGTERTGFWVKLFHSKLAMSIIGVAVVTLVSAGIIIGINLHNRNQSAFAQANNATTTVDFQTIAQPTNPAVDLTAEEEFVLVDPAEYAAEDVNPGNDSAGYGEEYYVDYYEPPAGTYFGIDVSKWQGYIDWNQVAASGVKFAFVRVGYRGWGTGTLVPDETAIQNLQGASAAGINVGVYFYSTACNYEEGVQEGKWVCQFIRGYNVTYPVVCDYEDFVIEGHRSYYTDNNSRTQAIRGFLDAVSAHGYQGMVYASKSHLTSSINTASLTAAGYKVWVAHYPSPPYPETSHTSYNATSYNVWQYTDKGILPGISGYVDLDFAYYGSAADDLLRETTTTQAPTTPPQTTTTTAPETTTTTKAPETPSEDTSADPNAGQNNNSETTSNN